MTRFALKIEYDGAPFCGWQKQADLPTVQGRVVDALSKLAPDRPDVVGAGRTDTGVHATGQVAHCDLEKPWEVFRLNEALNYHLRRSGVAVLAVAEVAPEFHARFDARERSYTFRLIYRRAPLTHEDGQAWQIGYPLDLEAMRLGAADLIGKHDFTTFRASHCQAKSPVKTLDEITISERLIPHGREYIFGLKARSFLHNQVRSIVGTLERVGAGAWAPTDVKAALEARERAACGPVCPAHGLYLSHVYYPSDPFGEEA